MKEICKGVNTIFIMLYVKFNGFHLILSHLCTSHRLSATMLMLLLCLTSSCIDSNCLGISCILLPPLASVDYQLPPEIQSAESLLKSPLSASSRAVSQRWKSKGSIVKMKKWGFVAGCGEQKCASVYPWEALRLHWSQKSQRRFWLSCCGQKPCIRAYYDVYYTKDCWMSRSMSYSIFLFKYKDLNSSCQMNTHFIKVFVK